LTGERPSELVLIKLAIAVYRYARILEVSAITGHAYAEKIIQNVTELRAWIVALTSYDQRIPKNISPNGVGCENPIIGLGV